MDKFTESYKRFQTWKDSEDSDIVGFCNWEIKKDRFMLTCWNSKSKGAVIFQIWEDGNGFTTYTTPTKLEEAAPQMRDALEEIIKTWNDPKNPSGAWEHVVHALATAAINGIEGKNEPEPERTWDDIEKQYDNRDMEEYEDSTFCEWLFDTHPAPTQY